MPAPTVKSFSQANSLVGVNITGLWGCFLCWMIFFFLIVWYFQTTLRNYQQQQGVKKKLPCSDPYLQVPAVELISPKGWVIFLVEVVLQTGLVFVFQGAILRKGRGRNGRYHGPIYQSCWSEAELFHSDAIPKSCSEMTALSNPRAHQGNRKWARNRYASGPSRELNKGQIRYRKKYKHFPQYMRV